MVVIPASRKAFISNVSGRATLISARRQITTYIPCGKTSYFCFISCAEGVGKDTVSYQVISSMSKRIFWTVASTTQLCIDDTRSSTTKYSSTSMRIPRCFFAT